MKKTQFNKYLMKTIGICDDIFACACLKCMLVFCCVWWLHLFKF